MATTSAPARRAAFAPASVNGVDPLAETAMTASPPRFPSAATARSAALRIVFRGCVEVERSAVAAGKDDGDPSAIETEGARQFSGVFRRNEAGSARAEIDAAAAALPSIGQARSRRADVAFGRRDALDRPPIGREQRAERAGAGSAVTRRPALRRPCPTYFRSSAPRTLGVPVVDTSCIFH